MDCFWERHAVLCCRQPLLTSIDNLWICWCLISLLARRAGKDKETAQKDYIAKVRGNPLAMVDAHHGRL